MLLSVCRDFLFDIRKEPLFFNSLIFTNSFARINNELNIDLEARSWFKVLVDRKSQRVFLLRFLWYHIAKLKLQKVRRENGFPACLFAFQHLAKDTCQHRSLLEALEDPLRRLRYWHCSPLLNATRRANRRLNCQITLNCLFCYSVLRWRSIASKSCKIALCLLAAPAWLHLSSSLWLLPLTLSQSSLLVFFNHAYAVNTVQSTATKLALPLHTSTECNRQYRNLHSKAPIYAFLPAIYQTSANSNQLRDHLLALVFVLTIFEVLKSHMSAQGNYSYDLCHFP